jgi:hypothetical protein
VKRQPCLPGRRRDGAHPVVEVAVDSKGQLAPLDGHIERGMRGNDQDQPFRDLSDPWREVFEKFGVGIGGHDLTIGLTCDKSTDGGHRAIVSDQIADLTLPAAP